MKNSKVIHLTSISRALRELGLPRPNHPLIALVDYKDIDIKAEDADKSFVFDFYKISFKKNFAGKIRYGQGYYDFEEGGLSFTAPNQIISRTQDEADYSGYTLLFHPDFIRNYPLASHINNYGFFSYSVSEALYLSNKEKKIIFSLFDAMIVELDTNIDTFSQDVMISHIELLLNYSNRFYNRQFITRKAVNHDMLAQMEAFLSSFLNDDSALIKGIPTVQHLADHLMVSPRYLTDMLKSLTGQTAQQHIHTHLIEKAKTILSSTDLSISEVAYKLGFEHPQSFNKFFKQKTNNSPVEFRRLFN
ncbi:MAG: AraC family transcriptional regulator [Chryseobacterium sp.]|nr:MAG: AraC family transcriptional regulator [Chryseobacterium sp.]